MQVVDVNITKRGTNEEYTVSTFCEDEGWVETHCSAAELDRVKNQQLELILDKEPI